MIDEKKIEEAARKYAFNKYNSTDDEVEDTYMEELQIAFKAGINWFLDNLWHNPYEKPKVKDGECCVICLVKFKNGSKEIASYFPSLEEKWHCDGVLYKTFLKNFDGWLYIDDLTKGGK